VSIGGESYEEADLQAIEDIRQSGKARQKGGLNFGLGESLKTNLKIDAQKLGQESAQGRPHGRSRTPDGR
jgi:hypothetical protein